MPGLHGSLPEQVTHKGPHRGGALKGKALLGLVGEVLGPGDYLLALLDKPHPTVKIHQLHAFDDLNIGI